MFFWRGKIMIKLYMGKIAMAAILALNGTTVGVDFDKQAEVYNPFFTTEQGSKKAFAEKTTAPCFVWILDTKPATKKVKK